MKKLKPAALLLTAISIFLISQTSCVVFTKKDNGKHKGWYKNSNNPHHPNSTNPGHSKSKTENKSNGKSKK